MTDHLITPLPELVQQWVDDIAPLGMLPLCIQAARWGADQELEACVEWLGEAPVVYNDNGDLHPGSYLRDARRPKTLNLKERLAEAIADGNESLALQLLNEAFPND